MSEPWTSSQGRLPTWPLTPLCGDARERSRYDRGAGQEFWMQVRMFVVSGILDGSGYVVWRNQKSGTRVTPVFGIACGGCRLVKSCGTPSPLLLSPLSSMLPAKAKWLQVSNPGSSANFWYSKLSNCGLNLECYGRGHIIRLPSMYSVYAITTTWSITLQLHRSIWE